MLYFCAKFELMWNSDQNIPYADFFCIPKHMKFLNHSTLLMILLREKPPTCNLQKMSFWHKLFV
jgi:hypothetical protein